MLLVILDGWGIGEKSESNPVHAANLETFRWMEENFPVTSLQASGISVGLPWGEVGNSEVGHLTIGAGKIIYQYYPKILLSIRDGSFFENKTLKDAFQHARKNNGSVNLAGLLTEGTVHAALEHLLALVEMGEKEKVPVKMHLFADGKDATPFRLQKVLEKIPRDKIGTLMGRYYGMDREKNWKLTERAYETMTGNGGPVTTDPNPVIEETYKKNYNEEFVPPMMLREDGGIKDGDALVFFNFREDSIRQIAESFILKDFDKFPRKDFKNLFIATMTKYEDQFNVSLVFPPEEITTSLGKMLSDAGKNQLRLAESYKYAHVTYFFNGYIESPFKNEYRVFVPSIKTTHVDEQPQMMAKPISDRVIETLETNAFDFVLVNFANPDTIAHTGNYEAALEAVKVIDQELGRILKVVLKNNAIMIVTSDHGNIEQLANPMTGLPETQHDPNPVPFYLIASEFRNRKFANWQTLKTETTGVLSDVAPTILELMKIQKSPEMTGQSLISQII